MNQRNQQSMLGKVKNVNNDVLELTEASKFLKTRVIYELVTMLDDLQIMPIDSESLG